MADVHTVAQYFLGKSSMTHKKLEKLCYYAQAWYLANFGTPLMPNRFEAWVHGPVSPDLYYRYKNWGWVEIPQEKNIPSLGQRECDILDQVYEVYGKYSGDELEVITHRETPWINARKGFSPSEYSRVPISMKDMKNYYGERIGKSYD